jgi:phosphatidylglycerol:prolipoprotein diacylglycerol transferase
MILHFTPKNEVFSIGNLTITMYGFLLALGMVAGLLVTCYLAKKRTIKSDDIIVLALYVFPFAFLGARIYYCLFYFDNVSFSQFFKFTDSGIAVIGSIIGGAIGGLIYCLIHKKNFLNICDIVVAGLALGQAIGRIGCFFAGCCFGEVVSQESLQFFPLSVMIDGTWHYATFFYESAWNLIGFALLIFVYNRTKAIGIPTATYLIWYGVGRSLIEGIRGDSLFIGKTDMRISQIMSIVMILIGVTIIVWHIIKVKKEKKNG